MREVKVRSVPGNNPDMMGLIRAIDALNACGVKLYTTIVQGYASNSRKFNLVTTSKDLHLALGALGEEGRYSFVRVLEKEFEQGKDNEFLIFFESGNNMVIFATLTHSHEHLMGIHLAPVR